MIPSAQAFSTVRFLRLDSQIAFNAGTHYVLARGSVFTLSDVVKRYFDVAPEVASLCLPPEVFPELVLTLMVEGLDFALPLNSNF